MDSNDQKDKIINEISSVVESLTLKLATLQAKVDELCKSTDTARVKKVNRDLLPQPLESRKHGININALREEE
tara:strand:- start:177 stop:395 length:219 start_codon:yes stop_codon:yes gene_type:complete